MLHSVPRGYGDDIPHDMIYKKIRQQADAPAVRIRIYKNAAGVYSQFQQNLMPYTCFFITDETGFALPITTSLYIMCGNDFTYIQTAQRAFER